MKGEQLELEGLAAEVRRRAGLSPDDFEVASRIAARVLGAQAVCLDRELATPAHLQQTEDGWQIVVNPGAPDIRFHVAHELGEWALKTIARFSGTAEERERAANRIAAAILAPEPEIRRAHATFGERVKPIAAHFDLSQTATVLRLAEVVGDERAVVTKTGHVLLRSQGTFPWAEVPVVDVARGTRWRGLARAQLRGGIDEGRVALRVR